MAFRVWREKYWLGLMEVCMSHSVRLTDHRPASGYDGLSKERHRATKRDGINNMV